MSDLPEALRLAERIISARDLMWHRDAAAELRRLYEKCEALTADTLEEMRRINEIRALVAQRDALLEALRLACNALQISLPISGLPEDQRAHSRALDAARAALTKVEARDGS